MRLVFVFFALAVAAVLWLFVFVITRESTRVYVSAAVALAFDVAAALALLAECWQNEQRAKLTKAAQERLEAWRRQPLDWPATTAIRDDTRRVADSETESIQCVP